MKHSLLTTATVIHDAIPPYKQPAITPANLLRQYRIVLTTLLASYRNDWFFQLFSGLLIPISLIYFARAIAPHIGTDQAIFMLGGNLAMSIAFGPTTFLIGKLGWARQAREFDYWIALPVQKTILVLAIISVALLFALPGLIGTYILGSIMMGIPFSGGWLLVVLVPLGVISLAGLGALLGSYAPTGQTAGVIANLLIVFIGFLSPMMISPDQLPTLIRFASWLIPTTYSADAFRAALSGQIGMNVVRDVIALIAFSALFLVIAHRLLDWGIS